MAKKIQIKVEVRELVMSPEQRISFYEETMPRLCEKYGFESNKIKSRAAPTDKSDSGYDRRAVLASYALKVCAKYRQAVAQGQPEMAIHYAMEASQAVGYLEAVGVYVYDQKRASYFGKEGKRAMAAAIWKQVSDHLKDRSDRPTAAVLYRTLKIHEAYGKSLKRFQGILIANGWRKAFPKVAK